MLRNYLTIAYRNLKRRPGYAAINVLGLAVGLAACILIGLYVQDELSYDDFHERADRTYRVLREFDMPDLQTTIDGTPSALAPALEASVPAVEQAVRVARSSMVVQHETRQFAESGFVWADAGFFEVFSLPMLRGDAALARPGTVVLTEAMAAKYFPNETPAGQTLRVGEHVLEVTGVMADVPPNSHLEYIDFVGSLQTTPPEPTWGLNNFSTYVVLAEGASKSEAAPHVAQVARANTMPDDPEAAEAQGNRFIPHLQPITGIHLGQGVSVEIGSAGNVLYVYLFGALAVFILLLACINFMNLATARSAERAGEVGMRKALGARREQLAGQFLGESVLMSLGALVLALLLCRAALPLLNQLAGKSLVFGAIFGGWHVPALVGLAVGVGLIAGSYPAFVLSGFEPTRVLKGAAQGARGSRRLRRGLVVFQFAITITILVGTGVVYQQLSFMRSAGLGFNEENLVVIEQAQHLGDQAETFKQELRQLPGVEHVTSGFDMPGTRFINSMWRPATPGAQRQNLNYSFVGFDYVETLGIEMAAGRGFSRELASDSFAVVLNEAALNDFGWTAEEAIGKEIERGFGDGGPYDYTVIGVAEDFHYESLHAEVYPAALFGPLRTQRYVAARVTPGDPGSSPGQAVAGALEGIRSTWGRFSELPLSYSFLADDLAAQYRAEERLASVFGLFAGLAILIACLGLFGLAAYTAQRRTKEIGVRKVLGASVPSIVALLSKDFLKLVGIAFVIAAPVAYWAMSTWLEVFAYRIEIGAGVFLLAGLLALVIALLAVSSHALRAARANPTEALRSE